MGDIVVTVPKQIWHEWLAEGDLAGEPYSGEAEYHFFSSAPFPFPVSPGDRLYIVAHNRLRGYAPIVRIDTQQSVTAENGGRLPDWWWGNAKYGIVRHNDAVAVTIPEEIRGFRGVQGRWWDREDEIPFPDWQTEGVKR